MIVQDLTESFIACVMGAGDMQTYEQSYPELFSHYFQYWCPRSYKCSDLPDSEIRTRGKLVRETLEKLELEFGGKGIDLQELSVVLFVGGNTSNGHAFCNGGHMVVWLPVETYANEIRARIFVTHELIHGLHYRNSPAFYFRSEEERLNLGRQLITEGLATYLTAEILGVSDREALWADYLNSEEWQNWLSTCEGRAVALRSLCRDYFATTSGQEMFMANDPQNIMRYRAGYFVGLCLVREIAEELHVGVCELLRFDRAEFEKLAIGRLAHP